MSDFIDRLGQELLRAQARQQRRRPPLRMGRSPRALALASALLALVAVPTVAAVTGVFKSAPRHLPQHPGLVDVGPRCVSHSLPTVKTTSDPAPAELTSIMGVLRRPQAAADRLPLDRLGALPLQGVNPSAIRLARSYRDWTYYLIPAQNVRYKAPLGDSPACRAARLQPAPQAGVCILEHSPRGGGAGCESAAAIRSGKSMWTSGGSNRGNTHAAGVVPDGVRTVIWRVQRGKGYRDTRIPVVGNVWAADVPGRHGHGIWLYLETAKGRRLVVEPHRLTARQRATRRIEKARDQAAGPQPSVFPAVGGVRSIFTLRVRLAHPRARVIYVATIRSSGCPKTKPQTLGMTPALAGPARGFMKALFTPYTRSGRWCVGTYRGTISTRPRARPVSGRGSVIARFAFRVR
jgi:hypothetical protein